LLWKNKNIYAKIEKAGKREETIQSARLLSHEDEKKEKSAAENRAGFLRPDQRAAGHEGTLALHVIRLPGIVYRTGMRERKIHDGNRNVDAGCFDHRNRTIPGRPDYGDGARGELSASERTVYMRGRILPVRNV
jgi:hypothetical protein